MCIVTFSLTIADFLMDLEDDDIVDEHFVGVLFPDRLFNTIEPFLIDVQRGNVRLQLSFCLFVPFTLSLLSFLILKLPSKWKAIAENFTALLSLDYAAAITQLGLPRLTKIVDMIAVTLLFSRFSFICRPCSLCFLIIMIISLSTSISWYGSSI